MAEKILNTRILLKYDTFDNWQASKSILKAGEVAICTVATTPTKNVDSIDAPQILMKVGDGTNTFANLPWASGLAADVYDWAKAENKPTYAASEITDLQNFVKGLDTNTTYQIIAGSKTGIYQLQSKEKGSSTWNNVGSEFGIDEQAIKDLIDTKADKDVVTLSLSSKAFGTDVVAYDTFKVDNDTITVTDIPWGETEEQKQTWTINNVADAKNVTATINGKAITNIFEANGITAKKATTATKASQDSIGRDIVNTYATKTELGNEVDELKKLINPGMEFKGVLPASGLPTDAKKGDTYKVGTPISGCKAGDAVIAIKDNPAATIDDVNWSVIPAGDDVEDTWRSIKVNDSQLKGNGISTGAINFKDGSNVTISGSGDNITINAKDTHYEGKNVVGASATAQANGTATADPYLNFVENGTVRSHHQIKGAGATKVTSDASGNIIITSTDTKTNTAHTHAAGAKLEVSGNGGTSGSVTYSHAEIATNKVDGGKGRTYITDLISDGYGHITGYKTATETVQNTDTWRAFLVNGTSFKTTDTNSGPINFKNGSNVTITKSGSNDLVINASYQDTKNTTGATNDATNTLYLVGARDQSVNPTTYSNNKVKITKSSHTTASAAGTALNVGAFAVDNFGSSDEVVGFYYNQDEFLRIAEHSDITDLDIGHADYTLSLYGSKERPTYKQGASGEVRNIAFTSDLPTVNNGKFTVSAGTGLSGSGSMTANQSSNTSATLSVKDYNNILTHKGGNNLQDEAGNTIIFQCGDSNF